MDVTGPLLEQKDPGRIELQGMTMVQNAAEQNSKPLQTLGKVNLVRDKVWSKTCAQTRTKMESH